MSATEATARIFDIQSFSLKDGPGIRTTIFFKGCPLKCRWCHNPESHSSLPQLMFHGNLCVGRMKCVESCRHGAHGVIPGDPSPLHVLDHGKCVGCGDCVDVCCYGALTLVGEDYTPSSLLKRIENDSRYFCLHGERGDEKGGLTFSGGEPMLYPDFIAEFCALVPDIHTAMETSGFAAAGAFKRVADCIDLFLFDFKIADPRKHEAWCGVDNSLILRNLDFLYRSGKEIILRLPLIQGVNDTADHADAVAALLGRYPRIRRAEILPYHTYGLGKLEELGMRVDPAVPEKAAAPELAKTWVEGLCRRVDAEVVCL